VASGHTKHGTGALKTRATHKAGQKAVRQPGLFGRQGPGGQGDWRNGNGPAVYRGQDPVTLLPGRTEIGESCDATSGHGLPPGRGRALRRRAGV
jgi:hypothetical protein